MGDVTDTDTELKFCIDCKYHYRSKCMHQSSVTYVDLCNGATKFKSVSLNRYKSLGGECGEEAKYFEPKAIKWYQFWK